MNINFIYRCSLLVSFLLGTQSLSAQLDREIGVQLRSFSSFGIIYKKEMSKDKFLRLRVSHMNSAMNVLNNRLNESFRLDISSRTGFGIGWEKRKELADKLMFAFGPDFSFGVNADYTLGRSQTGSMDATHAELYGLIGYALGLHYEIADNLIFGLEAIPGIGVEVELTSNNYSVIERLDSQISVNLIYRLGN